MALRSPLTLQPYDYIGDSTGRPLDKGQIYIGVAGQDPEFYQIPVFLDAEMTKPIDQPIRTNDGFVDFGGSLTELYASEEIYSLKVLDKQGRKVIYKAQMMRDNLTDDALQSLDDAIAESQAQAVITTTELVNESIDNIVLGEYRTDLTIKIDDEITRATDANLDLQNQLDALPFNDGVLADTAVAATIYHADTYARTQSSVRSDTVSLLDFIPNNLHEGIKSYTYAVDLKLYIQKAIDYCVLNNKKLNVPAGGYMFDPAYVPIYLISHWGASKNLVMEGAGQGLTIFKEKTGASIAGGRFTKMFYLYYGLAGFVGDFGHIKISGITFDKNASTSANDKDLYEYEQAHIIGAAGSGTVNIKSVKFEDIELKDKIGAGINFSSSPNVKIRKVLCSNIFSRNHPKVTDSGDNTFGQRGCLEFGTNIDTLDLVNCDVLYGQIEPVIASSPTLQRFANVSGGKIDAFEWTDKGGYSFANVVNLTCNNKFLVRGINANVTNSTLKIRENITGGIVKITGGTILLDYNAETNAISQFVHGTATGYTDYGELWLSNLAILIDNPNPALLPTGIALSGGTAGLKGSRKRFLNNVKFDDRLEQSIDAYGNGDWKITNCDLYGRTIHIGSGGTGSVRGGEVELTNNNYLGSGKKVYLYRNNALWSLKITGNYPYVSFYDSTGASEYSDAIVTRPTLTSSTKPASGVAPKGQIVINSNPVAGAYEKWIKIEEVGQVWKGVGLIEADSVAMTSGTTAQRPTGVAVGFNYFDTTLGKPIYFKSTGVWVDSTGVNV